MVTYGEAPQQAHDYPESAKDKIMHANLKKDNFNLMVGDTPNNEAKIGDNIQLYLNCESRVEVEKLYKALSENGKKTVPLNDTFWGSYFGMLIDQFGIHWMLGFDTPKK